MGKRSRETKMRFTLELKSQWLATDDLTSNCRHAKNTDDESYFKNEPHDRVPARPDQKRCPGIINEKRLIRKEAMIMKLDSSFHNLSRKVSPHGLVTTAPSNWPNQGPSSLCCMCPLESSGRISLH